MKTSIPWKRKQSDETCRVGNTGQPNTGKMNRDTRLPRLSEYPRIKAPPVKRRPPARGAGVIHVLVGGCSGSSSVNVAPWFTPSLCTFNSPPISFAASAPLCRPKP